MRKEIIGAVECWASRPTWFSSHPSDTKELKAAILELKKIRPIPTTEEIHMAIMHHLQDMPDMLGSPPDTNKAAHEFAVKISGKL
ncbi:hypothetical protein [Pragia fontium]|uniref:hypothetical protein n=1 Tax=Pragia fontium TaxID=82985 RepID=UPI00064ACB91|nr:hypothetical protein [Pragia fontium]AKJ41819.1 hypothetical protein QQ39_06750 [Pragia fontium]